MNPSISQSVGRAVALAAQCALSQTEVLANRLGEIRLLTSGDSMVREFAR